MVKENKNDETLTKRERMEKQRKLEKTKKILKYLLVGCVILLVIGIIMMFNIEKQSSPEYLNPNGLSDAQIQCIGEQFSFFGENWCPHCQDQKDILGKTLTDLTYIDCAENRAKCNDAGIEGYPTGIALNKYNSSAGVQRLLGAQSIDTILEVTGCING